MTYSTRHEAMYDDMIRELLRYGGLQETVKAMLRRVLIPNEKEARWVDDLYEIYGRQEVIDDAD